MSIWDKYESPKPNRVMRVVAFILLLAGGLVFLAGTIGQALRLSHLAQSEPSEISYQAEYKARSPEGMRPTPALFTRLPNREKTAALLPSLFPERKMTGDNSTGMTGKVVFATAPLFVATNSKSSVGPQQIKLPGDGEPLDLTVATFSSSEIPGVAGEWRVRPWWMPGWIPESADCGNGHSIIAGHVSWYKRPGPFQYLGAIEPGQIIECLSSKNNLISYEVTEVSRVDYTDVGTYWGTQDAQQSTKSTLTLYTCTPEVDGIIMVRAQQIIGDTNHADS